LGAQPAEHPAVAAGQVENVGIMGFVAEFGREIDELQRAAAEVEILLR